MTREQLDALEKLFLERSDSLDASSYDIPELIAHAREALELREALEVAFSDKIALYKDNNGKYYCAVVRGKHGRGKTFLGSTPLDAINNARRGK